MKIEIKNLKDLSSWAKSFCKTLSERDLILLKGEMGAGKTKIASEIISILGGEFAASPTFAIHNSYQMRSKEVDHFDLYRLESDEELVSCGFWDVFEKKSGLILVEWAQRLEGLGWVPQGWNCIEITIENTGSDKSSEKRTLIIQRR